MTDTIILITKTELGSTSPEDAAFGRDMLEKFLHSLESLPEKPKVICFYTEGVKLLAKGSPLELGLKLLAADGIRLVACQTCLKHYDLRDPLAVVETAGMDDIAALLTKAGKVITI